MPECRTAARTFHPIPSVQLHEYTRKNLPDAPRMKVHLKGCLLPQEGKDGVPEALKDIAKASVSLYMLAWPVSPNLH